MFLKVFLLSLIILPFAASYDDESDPLCNDSNFKWTSTQSGEMLGCEFLRPANAEERTKRLRNWCDRFVKGADYRDKNEAFIRDKCKKSCDNCCQEVCEDKEDFKWKEGIYTRNCAYLENKLNSAGTKMRKEKYCRMEVQGIGSQYTETCRVQEKCPVKCDNCCSQELLDSVYRRLQTVTY